MLAGTECWNRILFDEKRTSGAKTSGRSFEAQTNTTATRAATSDTTVVEALFWEPLP